MDNRGRPRIAWGSAASNENFALSVFLPPHTQMGPRHRPGFAEARRGSNGPAPRARGPSRAIKVRHRPKGCGLAPAMREISQRKAVKSPVASPSPAPAGAPRPSSSAAPSS